MVCEGLPCAWCKGLLGTGRGTAPKKTAHRLPGGRGRRQGCSSRPTAAGTGGAADTGEDARLGPGGGRRVGPGPPRGSDLREGEVRGKPDPGHRQASSEFSQHHILIQPPRTWSCKNSEGPASQIQGAAGLLQLILLQKKWIIYHRTRPEPETGGTMTL